MSVNKVIIIGNLGDNPDLRYTPNGVAVCNLSVATSTKYKDKEETEWHRVTLFKNNAENAGKYLKKGSKVYIEGRIKTESWEKDGEKKYSTGIIGNVIQFLDSRTESGSGAGRTRPSEDRDAGHGAGNPAQDNFDDDSIPF